MTDPLPNARPRSGSSGGRRRRGAPVAAVVVLWAVAVAVAGALAVSGLRAVGETTEAETVLSPQQALALASPASTPGPTAPTPSPTSPTTLPTTERRVPGAVLGLSCSAGTPVLVWVVPDPGWRVDGTETEDALLRVRLESAQEEVSVTIGCAGEVPQTVDVGREDVDKDD